MNLISKKYVKLSSVGLTIYGSGRFCGDGMYVENTYVSTRDGRMDHMPVHNRGSHDLYKTSVTGNMQHVSRYVEGIFIDARTQSNSNGALT